MLRHSKILCVSAIALYCSLVAFGNISDYYANFPAVVRALSMQELFADSTIGYRAVTNPFVHHLAFILVIGAESVTAILCILGAWRLFRARKASAPVFNQAKNCAIAGLSCGFLTWQVLFMSVGGEWFGLWMSVSLRGAITAAFQIFMTILGVLIYLAINDE